MARKIRIKDEERARIVLSRERDVEKLLDEKEKINQQLEMYMEQYAALTGETRVANAKYRGRGSRAGSLKALFITLGVAAVIVAAAVITFIILK